MWLIWKQQIMFKYKNMEAPSIIRMNALTSCRMCVINSSLQLSPTLTHPHPLYTLTNVFSIVVEYLWSCGRRRLMAAVAGVTFQNDWSMVPLILENLTCLQYFHMWNLTILKINKVLKYGKNCNTIACWMKQIVILKYKKDFYVFFYYRMIRNSWVS